MIESDMAETIYPAEQELTAALAPGPPLYFAMLFGSAATGTARPDSDIDIGIFPVDPNLKLFSELSLQTELSRVGGRYVDLVRLDRASTLLCWQVVRDGRVIFEPSRSRAVLFRARSIADYLDFGPALDRAAERFRRALVAGGRSTPP